MDSENSISPTSSEEIFRKLKDSRISYPEKINFATYIWNSSEIRFLNKEGFLSEWVCSTLVHSTKFPEARFGETPYLNLKYWELFNEALGKTRDDSASSVLLRNKGCRRDSTRNFDSSVICKLPLVYIFSSVMAYVSSSPGEDKDDHEMLTLLKTVNSCFHHLTTGEKNHFKPSTEQVSTLVQYACDFVTSVNSTLQNAENYEAILILRLELFYQVILFFDHEIIAISNPKKAYNLLIGKFFGILLHTRSFISELRSTSSNKDNNIKDISVNILQTIDNIFRYGLFHQEHVPEYALLSKSAQEGSDKVIKSYHDQLFDKFMEVLREETNNNRKLVGMLMEVIPLWYSYFTEELRYQFEGDSLSGHAKINLQDKSRTLEFDFFSELWKLIPQSMSDLMEPTTLKILFSVHVDLLSEVLRYNVYQAKSDDISVQQRDFLQKIAEFLISQATEIRSKCEIRADVARSLEILSQIEYVLLKPHIISIMNFILQDYSEPPAEETLSLAKMILENCSKSHEMHYFIDNLCVTLVDTEVDAEHVLRSPIFSRGFLDEFSNKISTNVSMTQAYEIIAHISKELYEKYLPTFLSRADESKVPNKRRKLDDNGYNDPSMNTHIMEPLISFIVRFLRALKITPTFKDEIDKIFQSLFDRLIYPVLTTEIRGKNKSMIAGMVYAALNLHHTLVDVSPDYWRKLSASEFAPIYNSVVDNISLKYPKVELYLNKVRLQHIYRTLTIMRSPHYDKNNMTQDAECISQKLSAVISTLVLPGSRQISWSGRLVDLNNENFAVANSALILGEWLDIICAICQEKELNLIIRFLIRGINIIKRSDNKVSIGTVCAQVLSTAEFFEIIPLRESFLKIFLEELGVIFKSVYEESGVKDSEEAKKEAHNIAKISFKEDQRALPELYNYVANCFDASTNHSKKKVLINIKSILKINKIISLLHLFPLEYFEKPEVNVLVTLALLIDKFVSLSHFQKASEIATILKCSILCRSLVRNYISLGIKQDDIVGKDQYFILCWIQSIFDYTNSIKKVMALSQREQVLKHYDNILQLTTQSTIILTRYMISRYRDDDSLNLNYLTRITKTFTGALDRSLNAIESNFDNILTYKFLWVFVADFLKFGYESLEQPLKSLKNGYRERDQEILEPFISLHRAVERSSVAIFENFLDNSTQRLQESENIDMKRKVLRHFTHLNSILKAYCVSCKFYKLDETFKERAVTQAHKLISLIPKFFVIITSLLRVPSTDEELEERPLADREEVKRCTELLSICMDFILSTEIYVGSQLSFDIISFSWEIMAILYEEDSKSELTKELDLTFGSFFSQLSTMKYDECAISIIKKLKCQSFYEMKNSNSRERKFVIHLLDNFLRNSTTAQLRSLHKELQDVIIGLGSLAESIDNIYDGIHILNTISFLVSHQALSLRSSDLGSILSAVLSLTSSNNQFQSEDQDYQNLFEEVCNLLIKILVNRREILSSTIATFVVIVQSMFHCFKSRGEVFANVKQSKNEQYQIRRYTTIWDARLKNPLSAESARLFSRLLEMISSKDIMRKQHKKPLLNRPFAKHVHNLIAEYLKVQTEGFLDSNTKESLRPGIFSLLDLCGEHERNMIMVSLDHAKKSSFRTLWAEYNKNWKYVGRG
ncbi:2574_t:CDS:10 [Acaulospora morrowiae]|uniref:2574_t:CDS:1 n=1 Tax=Acaulospora morrowiae TaxID=94023 RepID=A0A9N8ZPA3_9GLOM|nr:2574_t:CDS:10 [Acaulospora morrowiae]